MPINTLALDIETVPIAVDESTRRYLSTVAEQREMDVDKFMATCPALARIVCIGMQNPATGNSSILLDGSLFTGSLPGDTCVARDGEAALLTEFHSVVAKYSRLLTFAGRAFDLPTILHRSAINRVPIASIITRAARQKPWEREPHVDMQNELTIGGATGRYSLAVFGIGHGLANPKEQSDGSHVADLVRTGDAEALCRYCLGDVEATIGLARSWGVLA